MIEKTQLSLKNFVETIAKNTKDISIETSDISNLVKYLSDEKMKEVLDNHVIKPDLDSVKEKYNIHITADQEIPFYLLSIFMRWHRTEVEDDEGLLYGGFAFQSAKEIMYPQSKFWVTGSEDMRKFEKIDIDNAQLLKNLRWFETPIHPNRSASQYFGCVLPNEKSFPDKFYFYDDGNVYPLAITSYEDYINAMLRNAAVECWQYFYVAPEDLIKKNQGLNYMTTSLRHNTRIVSNMNGFTYNNLIEIDRLDLIYEYLKRCVDLLPTSFPTLNLGHQKAYFERFKSLMKQRL